MTSIVKQSLLASHDEFCLKLPSRCPRISDLSSRGAEQYPLAMNGHPNGP